MLLAEYSATSDSPNSAAPASTTPLAPVRTQRPTRKTVPSALATAPKKWV